MRKSQRLSLASVKKTIWRCVGKLIRLVAAEQETSSHLRQVHTKCERMLNRAVARWIRSCGLQLIGIIIGFIN